jgi:hypothetical protein
MYKFKANLNRFAAPGNCFSPQVFIYIATSANSEKFDIITQAINTINISAGLLSTHCFCNQMDRLNEIRAWLKKARVFSTSIKPSKTTSS